MTSINTKLIKDGNSTAVRLPKALLAMSGLEGSVRLEAKKGQIIIKRQHRRPREDWAEKIDKILAEQGDPVEDKDLEGWDMTSGDGLDNLPWNGPSYEQWQKQRSQD